MLHFIQVTGSLTCTTFSFVKKLKMDFQETNEPEEPTGVL